MFGLGNITSWWTGSSTTVQTGTTEQNRDTISPSPSDKDILIKEKLNVIEDIFKNPNTFKNRTLAELKEIKEFLTLNECQNISESIKKIDRLIQYKQWIHLLTGTPEQRSEILKTFPHPNIFSHPKISFKKKETEFSSIDLTIEQTIAAIEKDGSKFSKIILGQASDELLEKIAEVCINLTNLNIVRSPIIKGDFHLFTKKGLAEIGKIKKLTTLNLSCILFFDPEYLEELLNQPNLVKNIKHLILDPAPSSPYFDSSYSALKKYENLEKLEIDCSVETIISILQEGTFVPKLKKLHIKTDCITDDLLEALKSDKLKDILTDIKLSRSWEIESTGYWKAKSETFQKFLQNQKNLLSFELCNLIPVDDGIMQQIIAIPSLKACIIGNCESVDNSGFDKLYDMKKLEKFSLSMINASSEPNNFFGEVVLSQLCLIPLQHLYLDFKHSGQMSANALGILCRGKEISKSLKSLTLSGMTHAKVEGEEFSVIGNFENLEELCLQNCPWVTDDTIENLKTRPATKSLQVLNLDTVGITNNSLRIIFSDEFPNISTLGLSSCPAAMNKETPLLLIKSSLKERLKGLALNGLKVNLEEMKELVKSPKLVVFPISNNFSISFNTYFKDFKVPETVNFLYFGSGEIDVFKELREIQHLLNPTQQGELEGSSNLIKQQEKAS